MKIFNKKIADKGFFINLEKSTDRLDNVNTQILKFKIDNLNRFEALTDEMVQCSATKSHRGVFEIAKHENLDVVFVAEDDFQIYDECEYYDGQTKKFITVLNDVLRDLETVKWDVVLFGCNPKTPTVPITKNLATVCKSTGAWAYIIKKDAYEYILDNFNYRRDYLAIDDILPMLNFKGFVTLTTIPLMISHAVGYESTLQPRGPVNYTQWINGNYGAHLYSKYSKLENNKIHIKSNNIENDITILITGHFVDDFLKYLRYLLKSIPDELQSCKFHIHYDCSRENSDNDKKFLLSAYFRDTKYNLNANISYSFGGLISSIDSVIDKINTKFFILLEHDWVFLDKKSIDFEKLLLAMKRHHFVNAVWFNKDDNRLRGFEVETDITNKTTNFELDSRVIELPLITTCRWSNNPVIFKTEKFKEWYYKYIKNEHTNKVHQGCHNVEETMIRIYRDEIKNNKWEDIFDNWGTYLYGNIGDGPFVGHTDASQRYQTQNRTMAEDNGDKFMLNNPLNNND
jgi:hypothetical protein